MSTKYEELMSDPEFRKEMAIESLAADAAELVAQLMEQQHLSKADLARRLNKSRAWVTQLLSGQANMTVRTLAEVVFTLGAEVKLQHTQPAKAAQEPDRGAWRPLLGERTPYAFNSRISFQNLISVTSPAPQPDECDAEYAA